MGNACKELRSAGKSQKNSYYCIECTQSRIEDMPKHQKCKLCQDSAIYIITEPDCRAFRILNEFLIDHFLVNYHYYSFFSEC